MNSSAEEQTKENSDVEVYHAVGQEVRAARKRKGFSQGQLSMRTGIDLRYIKRIEAGEVNLSLNTINRISKALGFQFKVVIQ